MAINAAFQLRKATRTQQREELGPGVKVTGGHGDLTW